MENIELILSLAGTALSLLIACITFILKLSKSIKDKTLMRDSESILDMAASVMEIAEQFTYYTGPEKKEYVMTKVNQFATENNIAFDANSVSNKIEILIE